jgi:hypothetical protein
MELETRNELLQTIDEQRDQMRSMRQEIEMLKTQNWQLRVKLVRHENTLGIAA